MNEDIHGKHDDDALRLQLRGLRRDVQPGADLWPGIAARIASPVQGDARASAAPSVVVPMATARARRPRRLATWAMAASVLLAVGMVWRMGVPRDANAPDGNGVIRQQAVSMTLDYEGALARMQDGDPRPAGAHPEMRHAFGELDRSAAQILSAIDRDPDAAFLLDQLRRTYARRLQLTQRATLT